jgi:hypothetical protein
MRGQRVSAQACEQCMCTCAPGQAGKIKRSRNETFAGCTRSTKFSTHGQVCGHHPSRKLPKGTAVTSNRWAARHMSGVLVTCIAFEYSTTTRRSSRASQHLVFSLGSIVRANGDAVLSLFIHGGANKTKFSNRTCTVYSVPLHGGSAVVTVTS